MLKSLVRKVDELGGVFPSVGILNLTNIIRIPLVSPNTQGWTPPTSSKLAEISILILIFLTVYSWPSILVTPTSCAMFVRGMASTSELRGPALLKMLYFVSGLGLFARARRTFLLNPKRLLNRLRLPRVRRFRLKEILLFRLKAILALWEC